MFLPGGDVAPPAPSHQPGQGHCKTSRNGCNLCVSKMETQKTMPEAPLHNPDTTAIAAIEAVVQTYLDGLYEGDTEKLARAFHPHSELRSEKDGQLAELKRDAWLEAVRTRPNAKAQGLARHDRILAIDLAGPELAVVKLNCAIPPRFFTDVLVLLKLEGGWRIVSKAFRTEVR